MAYSRFADSDIYIYAHVGGWIECAACWLNERTDEYSLFSTILMGIFFISSSKTMPLLKYLREYKILVVAKRKRTKKFIQSSFI